MNPKRLAFTLFAILLALAAFWLAACTTAAQQAAAEPTAPTEVPTSIPTQGLVLPDPITVVQNYYEGLKAQDWDTVASYLADDMRWRGTPMLTGKTSLMPYLQAGSPDNSLTEINDLRATKGRVTFTWTFYLNGNFQASGEDTVTVENGKIISGESYAVLGSDVRSDMAEIAFTASDREFSGPDEIEGG
jgi:hypothetical protein